MPLIGLDIGTTGCKCTLFDFDGNIKSFAYQEYFVESPGRGQFELNPQKVWEAVKTVMYQAFHKNGAEPLEEDVSILSISSFGEAGVPVDHSGSILYNSILYTDSRGYEQADFLSERLGAEKIMELTGIPVHCMYSINKLMWMKENLPEVYRNMWKFLLFEDFIIYRLTGLPVIDYSLASRTMAFNLLEKEWDSGILEAVGISEGLFSEARPSGTIVGKIKKDIAQELDISPDTLVSTGGHDQACAALGAGILSEGSAVYGMGTAECITAAFRQPVLDQGMLKNHFNCEPHTLEGMYLTLSFTFSGGSLVKWYRDCFAAAEIAEARAKSISVYELLDMKAAKEPTSILVLPHFSGSGTPYMDPFSKGAITGLTLDTGASQLYRAILEGVTYEMRYNLECLKGSGIEAHCLRAVGGGARSELWLQIKADIMGRKIETLDIGEAGTLGAAILAGVASGVYPSINKAVDKLVKTKKVYYPNEKTRGIYDENYANYKRLYQASKAIYKV